MKIYNQEKTQELNQQELDFEKGYLQSDKLLIAHHEATPFVKGKSAEEIYNDLQADGLIAVRMIGGKYYTVDRAFENGVEIEPLSVTEWIAGVHSSSVTEIVDEPDTSAKEAWDDYEDIQVYVLYTAEELQERKLTKLRSQRETECFPVINRGQLWYDTLTEAQKTELKVWYLAWLDVTETFIIPITPEWVK